MMSSAHETYCNTDFLLVLGVASGIVGPSGSASQLSVSDRIVNERIPSLTAYIRIQRFMRK